MKISYYYACILLGLSINCAYAQNVVVNYRFQFLLNHDECYSQLIIPNENISFYEMFDKRDEQEPQRILDEENRHMTLIQRGAVYKNRIVVKKTQTGEIDYYDVEGGSYTKISEKLNGIVWELLDGRKTILGYKCSLAKGVHRGKRYNAWYASDIPYSDGPWKFNGLPGLILEIEREDRSLFIVADKIILNSKQLPAIKEPKFTEKYTWKEYVDKKLEELNQTKKQIISSNPSNEYITEMEMSVTEIDTTFTLK